MCGRFSLAVPLKDLLEVFGPLDIDPSVERLFAPRYNIAPTQQIAAVREEGGRRKLLALKWGLVPSWAKDPAIGVKMLNARGETVAEKPSFRSAYKKRRCVLPAGGFYEWKREGKNKQPFHIVRRDGRVLALAALWERWEPKDGAALETCAIVTIGPNAVMEPIHDRMPVILDGGTLDAWLNPETPAEDLPKLIAPCPADWIRAYPVSQKVNKATYNEADCVLPFEA
ncbi:MAG: SOS response-associated peptidase [Planctomycetes bacterium]|nr:SOS response-associated peptidase [Planctomycetota bacterium]